MAKTRVILLSFLFLFSINSYSQELGRSGLGVPNPYIQEQDGSPASRFQKLIVDNGSLVMNGTHAHLTASAGAMMGASYWTLTTAQTGITGDKSGSFDLTTTGNLKAGAGFTSEFGVLNDLLFNYAGEITSGGDVLQFMYDTQVIRIDGGLSHLDNNGKATFVDMSITTPVLIYNLSHNSFSGYLANEHIDWTNNLNPTKSFSTVADGAFHVGGNRQVNLGVEDAYGLLTGDGTNTVYLADGTNALTTANNISVGSVNGSSTSNWDTAYGWGNHADAGYFSSSSQVDHNSTTNYVAAQHIDWTNATSKFKTTVTESPTIVGTETYIAGQYIYNIGPVVGASDTYLGVGWDVDSNLGGSFAGGSNSFAYYSMRNALSVSTTFDDGGASAYAFYVPLEFTGSVTADGAFELGGLYVYSTANLGTTGITGKVGSNIYMTGTADTNIGASYNVSGATANKAINIVAGNVHLLSDTVTQYFGAANDASISFDSNSLNIIANLVTGADTLNITAASVQFGTTPLVTSGTIGAGATTVTNLTDSGLSITRIPYASTSGLLIDNAAFTFTTATGLLNTTGLTASGTVTGEQLTSTDDITMAGLLTNVMGATDRQGTYVDGATNDFTGVYTGSSCYINEFRRDYNVGTGNVPENIVNVGSYLTLKHTDAELAASYTYAMNFTTYDTGKHTNTTAVSKTMNRYGIQGNVQPSCTIDATGAGGAIVQNIGLSGGVSDTTKLYDTGASGVTRYLLNYAGEFSINSNPSKTSGTWTVNNKGVSINVAGSATVTSSNYGLYITSVTGLGSNYGIYDASIGTWVKAGGDLYWRTDGSKWRQGAGDDVYMSYNTDAPNNWDFYVVNATGAIRFNFGKIDTDYIIYGDDAAILTLDADTGEFKIGGGVAGYDQVITIDGETNDGLLTWMEDEDYFRFEDDVALNTGAFITLYNGVATEGYGVPAIVDHVALTAQAASIGTTNFTNAGTAGLYRVNYYLEATTLNAGATSVLATFGWTDDAGATTVVSATLVLTALGRTSGIFYVQLASGNITYATTLVDVSGLARYALYCTVERVN